jgi:quercetin dioxygenase-like cupin family protein
MICSGTLSASSTKNAEALMPVQWRATAVEFFSQRQIGLSTKWRSIMPDTTIKKVEAGTSPRGEMGQKYLVAGKRVSMRLWVQEPEGELKGPTKREYETVGYVISGRARLDLEGQTLDLKAGDSWLVPSGAMHHYTIIESFTAIEATAPPAEVHGRDAPA